MKQLFVMFFLLCSATIFAQDVIVKNDGSTVVCRIVELTSSEIIYKKWSDLNGSNYVMNRTDASAINYENGKKVSLSEATSLYLPNNQNDGVQQHNDKALLDIDYVASNPYKKVKRLRTIGWIGGGACIAAGIVCNVMWPDSEDVYIAIINYATGVAFTGTMLLIANYQKKKIDKRLQSISLWQKEIKMNDGSSLMAGVDMIKDNMRQKQTLGLGLRYNF